MRPTTMLEARLACGTVPDGFPQPIRLGAFASDNDVLRAMPTVVNVVAYVENFPPTIRDVAFWDASLTSE